MGNDLVLLLGDVADDGVTSLLVTLDLPYKRKQLRSSAENWERIAQMFKDHNVKMVIGKITGDVYNRMADPEYARALSELLTSIRSVPNRLFAYEDLLANRTTGEHEEFFRPELSVMQYGNEVFSEFGIEPLPYKKRAEVNVSAMSFLREVNDGLLFRIYVPSSKMWGEESGKLLALFKDYLAKIVGLSVRMDQQSTSEGVIYAFHGADISSNQGEVGELARYFDEFTQFTDLCVSDPDAAYIVLSEKHIASHEVAQIVARYSKEYRRLQLDIKHSREEKFCLFGINWNQSWLM